MHSDEDKCKNILAARRDRGSFPAKQQRATARAEAADAGVRTTKVGGDASCSDEDKCKNILAARRDRGSFPAKQQKATARAN